MIRNEEKFKIREAKSREDILGYIRVRAQTWADAYTNEERGIYRSMIEERFKAKMSEEYINRQHELLSDKTKKNWIAINKKQEVIGWCGCYKEDKEKGGFGIYVLPDYQGLGIGSKLLEYAIDWLQTQEYIEIGVVEYNYVAIEIYKKIGFKFTGEREDFPLKNFEGKNMVLKMRLDLR